MLQVIKDCLELMAVGAFVWTLVFWVQLLESAALS